MPGLTPKFNMADVSKKVDTFHKRKLRQMRDMLTFIGIRAVQYAKVSGAYLDQTGNLRSSVGYAVIHNGMTVVFESEGTAEGKLEAGGLIQTLADQYNEGMVLVVVAGMEYAAAVESKGYDVITGSTFEAEGLLEMMKKELQAGRYKERAGGDLGGVSRIP